MGKSVRVGAYRNPDVEAKRPEEFGDEITADHVVSNSEESEGITGDKDAVIIGDRSCGWIYGYPVPTKSADDTYASFAHFLGPGMTIRHVHGLIA